MAKEQYVPLQAGVAAVLDETAPVQKESALLEWIEKKLESHPAKKDGTV